MKRECLHRLILFGDDHLRRVLGEYVAHYNAERPHQGIGNEPIDEPVAQSCGEVVVSERVGGRLRRYHRSAA